MKNLIQYTVLVLLIATFFNCSKDDDDKNTLTGKWEVTGGVFLEGQPKYLIFNTDNTVSFLYEEILGFKVDYKTDYVVTSDTEIEIDVQGLTPFQYTLDENVMNIADGFGGNLQLIRNNGIPNANDWVQELSVLIEGNTPWSGELDIAFTYDKTKIVYGMNDSATYIPFINPLTFEGAGSFNTSNIAKVVEVENFDVPDRYLFQSNGDSNLISVYTINNGNFQFYLDADSEISGMASVDSQFLWVASNNNEGSIMLVNVAENTIVQTVSLNYRSINGLDYQDGYLYVADGEFLHKCQTTPIFKAVASYKIPNFGMVGVAFDGANFWVSGYDKADNYKLIKTSLSL